MIQTYRVEGLHCGSCVAKVEAALSEVDKVEQVSVSLKDETLTIQSQKAIAQQEIENKVTTAGYKLYNLKDSTSSVEAKDTRTWFQTYRPLLLIFIFISLISLVNQFNSSLFDFTTAMRHFMAGFFIVFSFFKLLNIKAFADAYHGYDIVAKQWRGYGLIYPFIELSLGLMYLINFNPLLTNIITLVVMGISTIGVVQSLLDKKQIQCACLGAVFDLPMSKVTLIEDLLMVLMAGGMLLMI